MKVGQIVIKLNGRFAGYYGYVKEILNDCYVVLGIPLNDRIIKEKKSNIKHILPVPGKIIKEDFLNDTSQVIDSFKKMGICVGKRIKV